MTFLRSRRGAAVLCAALVLVMFLFRPGAGRLKNRIVNSVSQALQRQVEIGRVHLRFLPRPGFDLEDFVVHDDPAFSAEPMLRAQEVTATLRLSALFRARLEVSRLSLTEPSLNLVRNEQSHWNIESILEHTAQTSVAPTGRNVSLARPEFPYIEADRGRINIKIGAEKKPFALADADYAFWQDSDSSWGMRLKAAPIRTDFNLSDTGIVRASGTWQRAGRLRETPLQFTVQWDGAQLGQVTKLMSGADRGWRGTVRAVANLSGEPSDLVVSSDASIDDFRRYDLPGGDPLRLRTHCEGHYSSVNRDFRDVGCTSPVGTGKVTLSGDIHRLAPPAYELTFAGDAVPLSAVLAAVRRAKRDLPSDLQAAGSLNFSATLRDGGSDHAPRLSGNGTTDGFKLQSALAKTTLTFGEVPLLFSSEQPAADRGQKGKRRHVDDDSVEGHQPRLVIGPFHMEPLPALAVRGILTKGGYSFTTVGEGEVKRLLQAARILGIPAPPPVADGTAKLDLRLAGDWQGFNPVLATGTAQLHGSRMELGGLNGPVEIASAAIRLQPDRLDVEAITASLAGSRWKGSLAMPRGCSRLADCPISFDLQADELVSDRLRTFADTSRPSPWYRVLNREPSPQPSLLARLRATGKLKTARCVLPNLTATHVATDVVLDRGRLHLSNMIAEVLGGKHSGTWDIDFAVRPPLYAGNGVFKQLVLTQLATSMHDPWLSGTGNGEYRFEARGRTMAELLGGAAGALQFDIHGGDLSHVMVEGGPLQVRRFAGTLLLKEGRFELQHGILDSASSGYSVTGSATWSRKLNFTLLSDSAPALTITGTLASPKVSGPHPTPNRATLEH